MSPVIPEYHIRECITQALPIIRNWMNQPLSDVIGLLAFIADHGTTEEREEVRTIRQQIEQRSHNKRIAR